MYVCIYVCLVLTDSNSFSLTNSSSSKSASKSSPPSKKSRFRCFCALSGSHTLCMYCMNVLLTGKYVFYACMYARIYVCTYICMYVLRRYEYDVCIYKCMDICACTYMYVYMYVYIGINVYMYVEVR
jgi:hypothetical protein